MTNSLKRKELIIMIRQLGSGFGRRAATVMMPLTSLVTVAFVPHFG